jgi:protoheme IX farnesyltransferase
VSDYWRLTRPKIVLMVLAAMLASGWAAAETVPRAALFHGILGAAGVIVGAIALNQRLERREDSIMTRTADRPLPSGRLESAQVTRFGAAASLLGIAYLICFGNAVLLILAIAGWILYVLVYTPLKKRSIWQTPIGAAAGAMPALLGAAAVGNPWSPIGWTIFAVVFFWQFPHSTAIAWLYRRQFAEAGVRLATVVDPSGKIAAWFALIGAIALLPTSLAPAVYGSMWWMGGVLAAMLGLGYLFFTCIFFRRADDAAARHLLWASLVYLPLVLIVLLAAR